MRKQHLCLTSDNLRTSELKGEKVGDHLFNWISEKCKHTVRKTYLLCCSRAQLSIITLPVVCLVARRVFVTRYVGRGYRSAAHLLWLAVVIVNNCHNRCFGSGTDLISLLILVLLLFLLGQTLNESLWLRRFKSDRDEIWQDCSSSKILIDWPGPIIGNDAIGSRSRPQRHFTQSAATWWVHTQRMSSTSVSSWSIVHSFPKFILH